MDDETANRFAGAPDQQGHPRGSPGEQSPLQARAAFLKNRSWELVIGYNRGACARGGAQHGFNRETQEATAKEWAEKQQQELSLAETLDFLRHCHRRAPFLFFNGNTFADVGRQLATVLFADLPNSRREVSSVIGHYIAGVLDHESMVAAVESLCETAEFKPGDRVKTLRGSTCGIIAKILEDGRIVWRPDGAKSELTALPESLSREK
jgi:acyl-coenzyme A thioesterase PaaI-like protein